MYGLVSRSYPCHFSDFCEKKNLSNPFFFLHLFLKNQNFFPFAPYFCFKKRLLFHYIGYLPGFAPIYPPNYLPRFLPSYLPCCPHSYPPSNLAGYSSGYPPSYLSTYPSNYLVRMTV